MIDEMIELSEWFRIRGMTDNAAFLLTVVDRLKMSPGSLLGKGKPKNMTDAALAARSANGKKGGWPKGRPRKPTSKPQ